jgi:hypothetical protein
MGSSTQTSTSYQQTTNTGASGTQGTGYSHWAMR